jgi:hypothetical protein
VPTQTWTCQGNTYLFSNSGPPGQFSATLSADGRQLIGGGTVATRVGGAAAKKPATEAAKPKAPAPTEPKAKTPAAAAKERQVQTAKAPGQKANSANCSTITGLPGGDSSAPCPQPGGSVIPLPPARGGASAPPAAAPARPRVVLLPPPSCSMCNVLITVGEVLPDLAEKLNNIKPETINDVGPLLYDGGARTLTVVPRRALAPITEAVDPLQQIDDIKDIADNLETLSDLAGKDKEPTDYAQACRGQFVDAAWKSFTSKDGGYYEKAKAASDSLINCWREAFKHIGDAVAKPVIDPDVSFEDN